MTAISVVSKDGSSHTDEAGVVFDPYSSAMELNIPDAGVAIWYEPRSKADGMAPWRFMRRQTIKPKRSEENNLTVEMFDV